MEVEARAFARLARNRDGPTHALQVRADDIHADAASRYGANLVGSGKARFEDELVLLCLRHAVDLGLGINPCSHSFLAQALGVDPAAIIGNDQADLVARLSSCKTKQADFALALFQSLRRCFHAMIDGVADDVGERIADHLDHLAVELDLAALEIHHDLLAELAGQVADQAGQGGKQVFEALHAHAGDRRAHIGEDGGEALEGAIDRRLFTGFAQAAGKVVARQHHVGNAFHDLVQQIYWQADRTLYRIALGSNGGRAVLFIRSRRNGGDIALHFDSGFRLESRNQRRIVLVLDQLLASLDQVCKIADPVDDGEHGRDQRRVGFTAAGPAFGKGILGCMAQFFQQGKIEKAAITLNGMHETEDRIDARPVGRIGFPRDEFSTALLEHFACFSDEFGQQLIHDVNGSPDIPQTLWTMMVNVWLGLPSSLGAVPQDTPYDKGREDASSDVGDQFRAVDGFGAKRGTQ